MFFFVNLLKSLISVLHSEISPRQIAGGIALGSIIGLTPITALHNYIVFFLILILKVNIGAAFLSLAVFKLLAFIIDPAANALGYGLLVNATFLKPFWTGLYNTPIIPYTRFNNTVVLGSLVIALILFIPVYLGSQKLVVMYRERWRQKVESLGIVKLFKLTSFYKFYDKYK